jgi:hypothetical protein
MSIVVECECGKRFRAKDELAGRNIPCPGCGSVLTIPEPAVRVAPLPPLPSEPKRAPSPAYGYPTRRGPSGPQKEAPRFAITKNAVIYTALFVIVPTVIYLVKIGPVHAVSKWKEMAPKVNDDIMQSITEYMIDNLKKSGLDMSKVLVHDLPKVTSLVLDEPMMPWTEIQQMEFQGKCSDGDFRGTYFFKANRIDVAFDQFGKTTKVKIHVDGDKYTFERE